MSGLLELFQRDLSASRIRRRENLPDGKGALLDVSTADMQNPALTMTVKDGENE